jgi:hypothetical protein
MLKIMYMHVYMIECDFTGRSVHEWFKKAKIGWYGVEAIEKHFNMLEGGGMFWGQGDSHKKAKMGGGRVDRSLRLVQKDTIIIPLSLQ